MEIPRHGACLDYDRALGLAFSVHLLDIYSLPDDVHLRALEFVRDGVVDSQFPTLDHVHYVPMADRLNSRDVTTPGGNHDSRLAAVEDGQAAANLARAAATGRDVDVGAGAGPNEELAIRAHFQVVVIAVRDCGRSSNRHRAEVNGRNFSASRSQGWCRRACTSVGAWLCAGHIERAPRK